MALTDLTRISTSGIATGTSLSGAILHGDAHFRGNQVGVNSAIFDSSERELNFKDNAKLTFGDATNGDLRIYHDPSNGSYIREAGPGALRIQGDAGIWIQNTSNQDRITADNGAVNLFSGGTKRFETTSTGSIVTGVLTATSFSGPIVGNTSNTSGISTFYDLRVSNNLTVEGSTTTLDTNLVGVDRVEVGANSNSIVGVAITQSGTADILKLYDGSTEVVSVRDGGDVGIARSIYHLNDIDTLIGFPVNGTVRITANNETVADFSGSYGGGGAIAFHKQVNATGGTVNISPTISSNTLPVLTVRNNTQSYDTILNFQNTNNRSSVIQWNNYNNSSTAGNLIFRSFNSPNTEYLRITGDGKLGIGTQTPAAKLDVIGDTKLQGNVNISGVTTVASDQSFIIGSNATSKFNIDFKQNSSNSRNSINSFYLDFTFHDIRFFNESGGSHIAYFWPSTVTLFANGAEKFKTKGDGITVFGVGDGHGILLDNTTFRNNITAESNRPGANNSILELDGKWNNTQVAFMTLSTGDDTTNKDDGRIRFFTKPSGGTIAERLTIDPDGRVGIGSAIPAAKLDVSPTIQVKNTELNGGATVDINAANGGQARLNLYAGVSGGVNRASRIDFHNQGNTPQWMLINDHTQNGGNEFSIRHGSEHAISCQPDGTVSLYDDGDESLRTDATGILVPEKVIHLGDTDTYLQFTTNTINLHAGGTTGLAVLDTSVRVPTKLGINGAAPQTPLDVIANGSGYAMAIRGRSSDNLAELRFTSNDYGTLYAQIVTGPTYLKFNISGTERFRITSEGRLTLSNSEGIQLSAKTSSLYATNGALSYYGTTNGVYLNGAGDSGWLRLQAAGSQNDRTSINLVGHSASSNADTIFARTNSTERFRIDSDGAAFFKGVSDGTKGTINLEAEDPFIRLYDTNGANDRRKWDIRLIGASGYEEIDFRTINDANSSFSSKMQIEYGGDVNINDGNLRVASGHGIDFSATANSTGTTQSELLDDYEEGYFAPTIKNLSSGYASGTFYNRQARYTKVGNMVTCWVHLQWWANATTTDNSGNAGGDNLELTILGFPFEMDGVGYGGCGGGGLQSQSWRYSGSGWNNYATTSDNVQPRIDASEQIRFGVIGHNAITGQVTQKSINGYSPNIEFCFTVRVTSYK